MQVDVLGGRRSFYEKERFVKPPVWCSVTSGFDFFDNVSGGGGTGEARASPSAGPDGPPRGPGPTPPRQRLGCRSCGRWFRRQTLWSVGGLLVVSSQGVQDSASQPSMAGLVRWSEPPDDEVGRGDLFCGSWVGAQRERGGSPQRSADFLQRLATTDVWGMVEFWFTRPAARTRRPW